MTTGLRRLIGTAVLAGGALTASAAADVTVHPLITRDDPIALSDVRLDVSDPAQPAFVFRLDNLTSQPVDARGIWIGETRFHTPAEARAARQPDGGLPLWDCGLVAPAVVSRTAATIAPGGWTMGRVEIDAHCTPRDHQHFAIGVERVSLDGRFEHAFWTRTPQEHSRLLSEAMPHP